MKIRIIFLIFFVLLNAGLVNASDASSSNFSTPNGLEGRVEFWKLIFTAYGKDQRVFHYRSYPEIIYSVLDFSDYEAKLSGRILEQKKRAAAQAETDNIRASLLNLANGKNATTALEKRIKRLFKNVPGGLEKYRKAATDDQIRYQTGIMERFRESLVRSGRYLPIIEKIFRAEGLPPELGRLPFIESSFDYEAYSSVGAAGIWQFMRTTGKLYMTVNNAIDERRDPVIASRAAAKYLKSAFQQLGTWPLALTSYNHGVGGIKRAVSSTGTTHLPTIIRNYDHKNFGFASSNFYAEFLAALEIDQHTDEYFRGLQRESVWQFDEVKLGRALSFSELYKYVGGDLNHLKELNLAFRSPILSSKVKIPAGTLVKVPDHRGKLLVASVPGSEIHEIVDGLVQPQKMLAYEKAESPPKLTTSSTTGSCRVKAGDTLSSIAKKNGVSLASLMSVNGLNSKSKIKLGQTIKIPSSGRQSGSLSNKATAVKPKSNAYRVHVVSQGESLYSISLKYKVSLSNLTTFNGLGAKAAIKVGQRLKIP